MKEILGKVYRSPAVRKAALALLLAIAAALGFGQLGCAELPPALSAARVQCDLRVIGGIPPEPDLETLRAAARALRDCADRPAGSIPAGEAS